MTNIRNLAATLSITCFGFGCAGTLQMLTGDKSSSKNDAQTEADEKGYRDINADFAKAQAGEIPADPKAWDEIRVAWYRSAYAARSAANACDKPDPSYSTQIGRDSPHCPDYKEIAEKARAGFVQFLVSSAESPVVDYAKLQQYIIDASQEENYAGLIPTAKLLAKLAEKKKAWFAERFKEFGDLRQHVAADSTGTCVFAERVLPKDVKSPDAVSYMGDLQSPKMFIRCVTPNKISTYPRDQADQLTLEIRVDGRWHTIHALNVENATSQGDTYEVELPSAIIKSKVTQSSKRLGSGAWIRASYLNSKITKVERKFENGKVIDRPLWNHEAIASGSLYLKLAD